MAHYIIQTNPNGDDWQDETTKLYKNRRRCKNGNPTAQPDFDERRRKGKYARMIYWNRGEKKSVEVTQ
jgi:hypothetical protein